MATTPASADRNPNPRTPPPPAHGSAARTRRSHQPPRQPLHVPEAQHSKDPQEAKLELAESAARDRKVEEPMLGEDDRRRAARAFGGDAAAKGVEAWKAEHDERTADEKQPKVVPGVAHRPVEAHEARR